MKKYYHLLPLSMVTLLTMTLPYAVSAHERRVYQIGTQSYNFVIGFLNEPATIGDKTGVDLTVNMGGTPTMGPDGDMDGPPTNTVNITGLEKTLKVEVGAGSEKMTFDLRPQYGNPGHYQAVFYPTVETTYSFRIFGTINNLPVDVTFGCNPSDQASADDKNMVKLSASVTQMSKSGAYGCPGSKADVEFPAAKVSLDGLDQKVQTLESDATSVGMKSWAGIVLGALGLGVGIGAWMKKPKGPLV